MWYVKYEYIQNTTKGLIVFYDSFKNITFLFIFYWILVEIHYAYVCVFFLIDD